MSTITDDLAKRDIIDTDERRDPEQVTRRHMHRPSVSGKELKLVDDG